MNSPVNSTTDPFRYTPDKDIQVHEEGAIKIICNTFQSHETGLPEWIKNSADEYVRCDAQKSERIIVVLFDNGAQNRTSSISVLDFGGISSNVIEQNFRRWADPEAATHREGSFNVQGGHGNGGKCYMTMMFEKFAFIHSVKNGLGNRYGVKGGSFRFGYVPDRIMGRSFTVDDVEYELEKVLQDIGYSLNLLPQSAIDTLRVREGFTLVTGYGPKGYRRKTAQNLVGALRGHPQMIRTLHLCDVFVMSQGRVLEGANPLTLDKVKPDPYITERKFDIPSELVDPQTEEIVSTTNEGTSANGRLILRTSDRSMRFSRKFLHNMIYESESGYIGYTSMIELGVQSTYINRIYGECQLVSLESAKLNTRDQLANSPLTRAVKEFIHSRVTELAREFELRDRRYYNQREKSELSRLNEILDEWKNKFLSEHIGAGVGPNGGNVTPKPPTSSYPSGIPARIEVSLDHSRAGIGVSFRPQIKFYDDQENRIRSLPFQWISLDTNVAWVDHDLNIVNTFAKGETTLWARTLDRSLESNKVLLRVLKLRTIHLQPNSVTLAAGTRKRIQAICTLSNGDTISDIALIWTEDNPVVARVSKYGMVFGGSPGITTITAGDDSCMADNDVEVTVTEGTANPGDERGLLYPRILVSSADSDPDTKDEVNLSRDDPPVLQRPQDVDRNIWWINSSAPLAHMYLDQKQGYGYSTREWRIYHIERYIEIIAQIKLISDPDLDRMDAETWVTNWGQYVTDVQAEAASSLGHFIQSGTVT